VKWHELHQLMPNRRHLSLGAWEPPNPLILAAWVASDEAKRERLGEHIACTNGKLVAVLAVTGATELMWPSPTVGCIALGAEEEHLPSRRALQPSGALSMRGRLAR
jgi:hypothetical protein